MAEATTSSFLDFFSALEDPRQQAKVLYPLPEILLLLLAGTLAGADDFVEMSLWGEQNLPLLRRFAPFAHGVPSHDTLGEVIRALDPEAFRESFTSWTAGLAWAEGDDAGADDAAGDGDAGAAVAAEAEVEVEVVAEVVAIDGKTSRRTHARRRGRAPLHLVSAWASDRRLVLGQQAVAEKSNEIMAIPELLARLEIAGALVTIDAIGTQVEIAETILAKGADYLLALKANHPLLHAEVVRFFADPAAAVERFETVDGDHGRIEIRRAAVTHEVDWLWSDRRYPDEPRFPAVAALAMVEAEVERDGRTSCERRYYLTSARLDAKTCARAVRAHWGVENRLHWVLDVVFGDDQARLRTGHGPENMAVVKHMALNLLKGAPRRTSLKNQRKLAGWNADYLEAILRRPQ